MLTGNLSLSQGLGDGGRGVEHESKFDRALETLEDRLGAQPRTDQLPALGTEPVPTPGGERLGRTGFRVQ